MDTHPETAYAADVTDRRPAQTTAARRRRLLLLRPLGVAGGAAALAGAFLAGTLVSPAGVDGVGSAGGPDGPGGPGGGAGQPIAGGDASPAAFRADLRPAESCEQLLASYVDRGLERVTAWGWDQGFSIPLPEPTGGFTADVARGGQAMARSASKGVRGQGSSATGTNTQEADVDEPDTVKTDGELLVRLRGRELHVFDVGGVAVERRAVLDLPGLQDGELLLTGDTVVALGADASSPRDDRTGLRRSTLLYAVSLADPARPEVVEEVTYSSAVMSAKQHGSTVRLVLSAGLPELDFARPRKGVSQERALRTNRDLVEATTIEDWLPTYDAGHGPRQLLDCEQVAVPDEDLALDTVSIVGFDAATPAAPQAIGLAGAATTAYASADQLYLAAGPAPLWQAPLWPDPLWWGECWDCVPLPGGGTGRDAGTTRLFAFDLDGTSAAHVASGEVEGSIRDRWSMDAVEGTLRLAVGPSTETGDFTSVVTFRREGAELVEAGRVGRLGRGEELKSVRWFDGLAILVTFRRIDPLYAVDLSDPASPRLLSELKIPGFSSYLHPLDEDTLLGLGQGPGEGRRWGAQAGLFDTTDLADVRRTAVHSFAPGSFPLAELDPRAFTWLPEHRTALTVVQRGRAGHVAVLRVGDGTLDVSIRRVETGDDVTEVRTLPLPDGRVALVTGEDVRLLTW